MSAAIAKITRPNPEGGARRERLFRLLDSGRKRPVIWIAGPAGSGKTTLVTSYLEEQGVPSLWYDVDEGDGDIASFFYYLTLATKGAVPRCPPLPLLTPEYFPGIATFTRRYFEELCKLLPSSSALVFDNYQEVAAGADLHIIFPEGLAMLPEGITAIFISRGDLPPSFSRLSANNRVSFIGWDELRFTVQEAADLVRSQKRGEPSAEAMEHLHRQTDGWAAGLVLALEKAQNGSFASSDLPMERIFDYFASQVFSRLDDEARDFLVKTALLPHLPIALAERLTGSTRAKRILAELHRKNYFTDKLDAPTAVYRYHPLFREFLLQRGEELLRPADLDRIERRAGELLAEAGEVESAVALLLRAGNWEAVALLAMQNARSLLEQGRSATLESWLAALPPELCDHLPWLLYWKGVCKLFILPGESRSLFEAAFGRFQENGDLLGTMLAWSGVVDSLMFEVDDLTLLDPWIHWLDEWSSQEGEFPSPEIEAKVAATMAWALIWRQPQHRNIAAWMERAMTLTERHPDMSLRLQILICAVNFYCWMGDYQRYALVVEEARKLESSNAITPAVRIVWKAMTAIIGGGAPDIYDPLQAAEEGLALAGEHGLHVWDLILLSQGAYSSLSKGDLTAAGAFLKLMEPLAVHTGRSNQAQYHGIRGWHALLSRDFAKARVHAEKFKELTRTTGIPIPEIISRHLLAQVMYESGDTEGAWRELNETRDMISGIGTLFMLHISLLLEARFCLEHGREKEGMDALCQAIALGKERRYETLLFRWPAAKLAELYATALEAGFETEYVCGLIRKLSLSLEPPQVTLQQWPWELKIYTLGRFGMVRDGVPVRFSGKVQQKPLEMLKALIALGGRDVAEERLCDELWPDADGDAAHKAFSVNLVRLRRLIGHDRALIFQDGRLSLDDRCCWVDTVAFERLAAEAEGLWNGRQVNQSSKSSAIGAIAERASRAATLTEKAIALYSGHFLSAESGSSWAISARERLRAKFIRLVETLGGYWESAGQLDRAIACCQKGLETDDLIEEFYQRLMVCYRELGQQAKGVELYRRCRLKLAAELGIKPSAKTEAIYKTLLN